MSAHTPISDGCHSTPHQLPFSRCHSGTAARRTPRGRINTPLSARKTPGDRFIPNRAATDVDFASYKVNSSIRAGSANAPTTTLSPSDLEKRKTARDRLFSLKGCSSETRVLNFKQTQATCSSGGRNTPGKCNCYCSVMPPHCVNLAFLSPLYRSVLESLHLLPLLFCQEEG